MVNDETEFSKFESESLSKLKMGDFTKKAKDASLVAILTEIDSIRNGRAEKPATDVYALPNEKSARAERRALYKVLGSHGTLCDRWDYTQSM